MRDLIFLPPDADYTAPPSGWDSRHDKLFREFIIASNGKPWLSKLTTAEWKHAVKDMVHAIGTDNRNIENVLSRVLARHANVERTLMAMVEGKRPMPTADTLREMAQILGVPTKVPTLRETAGS